MADESRMLTLEDLGFSHFFESGMASLGLTKYPVARVIAEFKEAYRVKNAEGEYLAKIPGKQLHGATRREDYPAVGDWVTIESIDIDRAVIHRILPRRSILKRKYIDKQDLQVIAANIDVAFVIESVDRDYNLNRLERYIVLANDAEIDPVIILNKADLISKTELDSHVEEVKSRFNDVDVIPTSAIDVCGVRELAGIIKGGETYCFLGSSGVGKSSLINKLLNKDEIQTGEISEKTGRGKHTTTAREMYFLKSGGIVIDNPGIREVGIAGAKGGVVKVFDEIASISGNCKFTDCTHTHEPGCAVLRAIDRNELDRGKFQNYIRLKKETEYYEMDEIERKEKDRKFGRYVKKTLDQLKKFK